ncbi:FadR/GntR family transcriptional regulator [Gordonia sp. SL306]|uniref:FadR/GntR family transcriptional regulator n=1 Tax=Gordonia sp. SL306 TaxID=2995145 RepID=UPI00227184B4|nr:FCD domain-containing protein [Gordonia sp. SL306]WAC56605.1 FCD domain-containing protein [Gordonia sp. SL306]
MTGPARSPKAAVVFSQRIVQEALDAGLGPGDLLPSEKIMVEKYQIGRGTLREALRLLEFQGVVVMKPGPRGGPVLQEPTGAFLSGAFVLLMQLRNAPLRSIFEARLSIEPVITQLAAANISDERLAEVGATVEQMKSALRSDRRAFLEANKEFHDIIAWSTDNPLLGYLADSLLEVTNGTIVGMDFPQARRKATLAAHESIYTAMSERDAGASMAAMREHIDDYLSYAEKKFPDIIRSVVRWDRDL